jgi:plastocyanin
MSSKSTMRRLAALGAAGAFAFALSACQVKDDGDDLIAGKEAFVAKCGSCHVLARAGTTGTQGPNLDEAFRTALSEGFGRDTVEGVVRRQIEQPARSAQLDPKTKQRTVAMAPNIVEGELAEDVAAYVAFATARKGEDTGRLADLTAGKATESTQASNGVLDMPANPDGQLIYDFAAATAPPGQLTITSKNDSSVPHNIALEGGGIDEKGAVVQGGGTSEIQVNVQPGEYTFYCSVPGHREGGMAGVLTVK